MKIKLFRTIVLDDGYEKQEEVFFNKSLIDRHIKESGYELYNDFLENYTSDDIYCIEDMGFLG